MTFVFRACAIAVALLVAAACSEQPVDQVITVTIKDHKFSPDRIAVPAGQRIKLLVRNEDATAEEFESHDLNREKIIGPGQEAAIVVGPLEAGEYHFFGEFNMDTAQGFVVVE